MEIENGLDRSQVLDSATSCNETKALGQRISRDMQCNGGDDLRLSVG